jgi:shikimate kinase
MNRQLQENNIYLIGMMGSGKTTVGKLLAEKLDYRFFDTDDLIERLAQKTISEIFATEGEVRFRELESQVLRKLSAYNRSAFIESAPAASRAKLWRCAIATGGGIVQRQENWSYLRHGLIIWLDADLKLLNQRLTGDNSRPLANQIELLLETRRPFYNQADLRIAIKPEQTPEDIVTKIICYRLD